MHNLHFVVIKAYSAEDACDSVESLISDYGDENNWRTICGCVSEDNEVFDKDIENDIFKGRYCPTDMELTSIEEINKYIKTVVGTTGTYSSAAIEKLKEEPDITKWKDSHALWSLGEYAKELRNNLGIDPENIDVFNLSYYEHEYDEFGVTPFLEDGFNEGDKKYVVFVDMHS
jgi:hypothetical protein